MTAISNITRFLNEFAPLELAEGWDNVGLLIGDATRNARNVMTCLTITPDVVEEAVAKQVDLIVSHHPLLFKPVQKLVAHDPQGAMLLQLIEACISVYSPHTAFDSAGQGINQQLAAGLHLQEIQPFRVFSKAGETSADTAGPEIGSGRFGNLPHPITLDELCSLIRPLMRVTRLQRVGESDRTVCRVGVACGAAAEFITDALRAKCDVLITGEARFHDCLKARDAGLALILPGHYATERPAVEVLAQTLQATFPQLQVFASTRETDPIEIV